MKRSKKGFTLAELLIVIAIIAILIAIMIPVFGAQIDKAKAAAELANVRAKYSELVADAMLGGTDLTAVTGTVTVSHAALKTAVQDTTKTKVYVAELEAQPDTVATTNWTETVSSGSEVTIDPETESNKDIYIIVVYDGTYMGSFAVDDDVTIGA